MSKKLAIKRVGTFLPTLCLLVFVTLCGAAMWLSTAGLPRFVVDKIEAAVANEGIPLKIQKVKLSIFRHAGVKAEGVSVYATPESETPILTIDSVHATFSPLKLFIGEIEPRTLVLNKGRIALPISDTPEFQELAATDINITARFHRNHILVNTSDLKLQGIPIHLKGAFNLDELMAGESAQEEQEKLVIPAIIKTCQSIVDRTYHLIEEQHWSPSEFPELHLDISAGDEIKLKVQAEAPKYDIDQFCFREAKVDFNYEGDRFIIHNLSFKTIQPDSQVQLKGGYELETRTLSVTLESDAALLEMAKALSEGEMLEQLNKFSHSKENCPHIQLSVNAVFGEDFSLHNATFNGELEQHALHIGDSVVDHVFISFFYNNGNFNIDNLTLKFPDGKIKCTAVSNNGSGIAELHADLPIIRTISLVNEFLSEPIAIPAGLKLGEHIKLNAKANLSMPEFKPGDSYEHHFIPEVQQLDVSIGLDKLAFIDYELQNPSIALSCKKEEGQEVSLLQKVHLISTDIQAKGATLKISDDKTLKLDIPTVKLTLNDLEVHDGDKGITLKGAELSLNGNSIDWNGLTSGCFHFNSTLNQIEYKEDAFGMNAADLSIHIDKLIKDELAIGSINISANAHSAKGGLLPSAPETADIKLDVNGLYYENKEMGHLNALVQLQKNEEGLINLQFTPAAESKEKAAILTGIATIDNESILKVRNISAYLPCANLEHVAEAFDVELKDIEMPHDVSMQGALSLNMDTWRLNNAQLKLNIPQLVRTPHKLKAFQGERVTIDLMADLEMENGTAGEVLYKGNVELTHATGVLNAELEGNTQSHIHVTGTNSIRPDVVDRLLDYDEAHAIIRDFRFEEGSSADIENIVVDVRYDNGLDVAVDCDVTLDKVQYQLCAIEEDENGNEVICKELEKLPFTHTEKGICHLRVDYREDIVKDGKTLPTVIDITLSDVTLVYNNRPWLQQQDFSKIGLTKQGPGATKHKTSTLKGKKVVIDIENGAVRLTDVHGSVYAGYSLGMFYSDLRDYLSILITPYPTTISTDYCQFPIYSDSTEEMKGHIRAESEQLVALDFLGTEIPLTKLTGFIGLHDGYIYLDRMNALCWNGTVNAAVKVGISDDSPAFDGKVTAKNVDLKKIAAAYGADMDSALCEANFRFLSPTSNINDIRGYGKARIVNGNLMALSIFQPIGAFVSDITGNIKELDESAKQHKTENVLQKLSRTTGSTINAIGNQLDKTAQFIPGYNHVFAYDIQDAFIDFVLDKGHFRTTYLKALGYNLKVTGKIDIDLETLDIYGNMWPQVSSLPTLVLSPITFLSDFMLDIVIFGKIDDLKWEFRLDPRISNNNPKTADTAKDKDCPNKKR